MEAGLTLPAADSCLRRPLNGSRLTIAALTIVVAVLTRAVTFGNPAATLERDYRTVYTTPGHGSIVSLRVSQRRDLRFNSR